MYQLSNKGVHKDKFNKTFPLHNLEFVEILVPENLRKVSVTYDTSTNSRTWDLQANPTIHPLTASSKIHRDQNNVPVSWSTPMYPISVKSYYCNQINLHCYSLPSNYVMNNTYMSGPRDKNNRQAKNIEAKCPLKNENSNKFRSLIFIQ